MSSLVQKKKGGNYYYVRDNKWKSTKTNVRALAEAKKNELDKDVWMEKELGVKAPALWDEFFADYLDNYKTDHAPSSIYHMTYAASIFKKIVNPIFLTDVTAESFAIFKTHLMRTVYGEGTRKGQCRLQARSVNSLMSYLRPFFKTAHAWGKIPVDPCFGIKAIPESKKTPHWLEREDLNKLLSDAFARIPAMPVTPPDVDAAADIYLAMLMEQDTGMRADEVIHQRIEDIDFEHGFIEVKFHVDGRQGPQCQCYACQRQFKEFGIWGWTTKNRTERLIPLTPRLHEALQEVRRHRKTGAIFEWHKGTISNGIKRCFQRLGIPGRNHTFRHSFKTEMRRAGMNETVINNILGHGERSVSDHYDHTNKAEIMREFQKLLAFRGEWEKKALESKLNVI